MHQSRFRREANTAKSGCACLAPVSQKTPGQIAYRLDLWNTSFVEPSNSKLRLAEP